MTVEELSDRIRDRVDAVLAKTGTPAGRAMLAMAALELELERRRLLLKRLLRERAALLIEAEERVDSDAGL